jgi:hypothetical protein
VRIFWRQNGLEILPEDEGEIRMLRALTRNLGPGTHAEIRFQISVVETSGGNSWFEIAGKKERTACARKRGGKKGVIVINTPGASEPS